MTFLIVVETVVLAALTVLAIGLLHSHAAVLRQLRELGPSGSPSSVPVSFSPSASGTTGHDLRGETPLGEPAAVTVVGASQDTLLAFLSSGCTTCGTFWQSFADPARLDVPASTQVVVVTRGPASESVSAVGEHVLGGIPVVMSDEAWDQYRVPGAPYFVLVEGRSGRVVGEGRADRWHQVLSLITRSLPADRRSRVDAELLAAGIGPGHPSLHPDRGPDEEGSTS